MGIDLPTEFPTIDNTKYYKVTVDAYQDAGPETDCTQTFINTFTCCKLGNILNAWIDNDLECIGGMELCVVSGFTAQRLKTIQGPFDTEAACLLA